MDQSRTIFFGKGDKSLWIKINFKKTKILYQPSQTASSIQGRVNLQKNQLASVHSFTYLGNTITDDMKLDTELQTRMSKAAATFEKDYGTTTMLEPR